jgi:hypothetical protein
MTGVLVWGKNRRGKNGFPVRVEGAWPAIVDSETFNRVQNVLASRSPRITKPRSITSNYLLGGMMRCAECGAPMIGCAAKSGQFFYYRCNNALRRGPGACRSRWLPKSKIEGFVIDKIKHYILTDENLTELIKMTNEEIEALSEEKDEYVKTLDRQIRDTDSRLEYLYDALETGRFNTDELAPRIHALVTRRAELQSAKDEAMSTLQAKKIMIKDIEIMRHYVEDLRSLLSSATIMEQKTFLKSFVKGIDVSNSEVTLNYTLPMPPLNTDKETIGVLAFIHNGEAQRTRTPNRLIKSQP